MPAYDQQVFLNVPFDLRYRKLLQALVFTVHDCGLVARCALEREDSGEVRAQKILEIIQECRFGIHDLSRTTLDSTYRLPRFNMPLELGVFLGAKRFGTGVQRRKSCLVLDRDLYRYQVFCSDISGQDIRAHANQVLMAVRAVRNWLQANLPHPANLPGPSAIESRYVEFRRQLPAMCRFSMLRESELTFIDYRTMVQGWIDVNPR